MHSDLRFEEPAEAAEQRKKAHACPKTGKTLRRPDLEDAHLEEERRRPPAGG
jgi:hypothetical protein